MTAATSDSLQEILVPLAFNEQAMHAAGVAAELARATGARLHLLHVIETVKGIPFDELREFYDRLSAQGRERLEAAANELRGGADVDISVELTFGSRPEQIVRVALERGTSLIVLSSHAAAADGKRTPMGTISYKVGALAPCSVMLVR